MMNHHFHPLYLSTPGFWMRTIHWQPVIISDNWTNIPISQLFDFTNDSWCSRYAQFASLNFEEELELYDLLEMDAEGDNDPEARFDDTTQDILLG
jgi:hypothetical protein